MLESQAKILAWDAVLDGWHEAVLYSGGTPDLIELDPSLLVQGPNVFAVEVHNNNVQSSDFTARPFLFLGAVTPNVTFETPPAWFQEPAADSHNVTFNVNMANERCPQRACFWRGAAILGSQATSP